MPDPTLTTLWESHFRMLSGSYFSAIQEDGMGGRYAWSETVPDIIFNYGIGTSAAQLDWALRTAGGRRRSPAVLSENADALAELRGDHRFSEAWPERWMTLSDPAAADQASMQSYRRANELTRLLSPSRAGASAPLAHTVVAYDGPVPPAAFFQAFAAAHPNAEIAAHVERYYAAALKAARAVPGVSSIHLVAFDGPRPVACASLYVEGRLAGLYNVATAVEDQGKGFGEAISRYALTVAGNHRCRTVFLQCAAESAAERLYRRIGFRTVHTAYLACFGKDEP